MTTPVLRLGILGATNAVESTYLPTLHALHTHFHLTIIYDTNQEAARRCQKRFNIPSSTTTPDDVLRHPEVDLILNLFPFEYHEQYTIAALEAGKHVMVEVPLSLSIQGLRRIRDATKKGIATRSHAGGAYAGAPKVFVGCARRYAPCFADVFKKELASLDRVNYARCRNILGPMTIPAVHHSPNGTNGVDGTNGVNGVGDTNSVDRVNGTNGVDNITNEKQFHTLLADVFGSEEDITPDRVAFCRFLGTLGCHDLSLMRDSLGFPDAVSNVAITDPFYSAIFHYTDDSGVDGHPFTLLYEAGVDAVPRCDAHLTVYGTRKTISVEYDFPCPDEAVGKERSVRVVVEETETVPESELSNGHENGNGVAGNGNGYGTSNGNGKGNGVVRLRVKRTEYVSSCAEAYEREFLALHSCLTDGTGPEAKTTAEDALNDLRLLHMIFSHYDRQCGTIRTPLG